MQCSGSFPTLDAKLAAALSKVTTDELGRQINFKKEQAALHGNFLKGRQILSLLYEHYRVCETDGAILEFQDLLNIEMQGGGLRAFLNEWEIARVGMSKVPTTDVLEILFRIHIQKHSGLKEHLSYYERLPSGHEDKKLRLFAFHRAPLPRNQTKKQSAGRARAWRRKSPPGVRRQFAQGQRRLLLVDQTGKVRSWVGMPIRA